MRWWPRRRAEGATATEPAPIPERAWALRTDPDPRRGPDGQASVWRKRHAAALIKARRVVKDGHPLSQLGMARALMELDEVLGDVSSR